MLKHFIITYCIGSTAFNSECSTAAEAFASIMDIGAHDKNTLLIENADEYMKILVDMLSGKTLSHEHGRVRIAYVDGEV